ncbi:unnamed protein product [Didymodactylos carnosus]|uniref:C2 domain-containing protein n=1 Tax=Didymodactylos carnosus TaxID=1234261 RepID=A0A815THG4_9BILA|nr:unnamed protein product [Didymodactylos carnosus]CAF1506525.1 unnamed protein product [Didymodactylos carnosus]CAF4071158.1 unnamed protein product [Didymodactylos carnosus]CAF4367743.1 unnamed protein product [Didymodactylos carnosus]
MSDFLGRIGRITEWVVVSNLENRAVNAACDKASDLWKNRNNKNKKEPPPQFQPPQAVAAAAQPTYVPPKPDQPAFLLDQSQQQYNPYQQQQYPPQPQYYNSPQPLMNGPPSQLIVTIQCVQDLHTINYNQQFPMMPYVILECNYQRHQTSPLYQSGTQWISSGTSQFIFPLNNIEMDRFFVWIQDGQNQQNLLARGEFSVRWLFDNSRGQQQQWLPLRNQYDQPAGQILVSIDYKQNTPSNNNFPLPYQPPPPYY